MATVNFKYTGIIRGENRAIIAEIRVEKKENFNSFLKTTDVSFKIKKLSAKFTIKEISTLISMRAPFEKL